MCILDVHVMMSMIFLCFKNLGLRNACNRSSISHGPPSMLCGGHTQRSNVARERERDMEDDLEYDLGYLSAFDMHPFEEKAMKKSTGRTVRDRAEKNVQLLINRLFASERVEVRLFACFFLSLVLYGYCVLSMY